MGLRGHLFANAVLVVIQSFTTHHLQNGDSSHATIELSPQRNVTMTNLIAPNVIDYDLAAQYNNLLVLEPTCQFAT